MDEAFEKEKNDEFKTRFNKGMLFAYESIKRLADKLKES